MAPSVTASHYYSEQDCNTDDFEALVSRRLDPDTLRFASRVENNIPLYEASELAKPLAGENRQSVMSEWANVLDSESGVLVIKGAIADTAALDAATGIFDAIIARQRQAGAGADHFGESGANDRVWNALQKLCDADASVFVRYFSSISIAAVCEAWLGPGYQMTAQVNLVHPGGKAQVAHRDYHLGFMSVDQAAAFPRHAHALSAALTLQGAVAHCDMPVASGPTKLLPFSQSYGPGYLACQLPAFRDIFEARCVQLPLSKGDAVFFNPALFHAAGDNHTADVSRLANLLQISSAMGRSTEAVDRAAMARQVYPALQATTLDPLSRAAVIAATAEGYSFPTNLDDDPPVGGLATESQAALMHRALDEGLSVADFQTALESQSARRSAWRRT